jgi:hypothetical protein
MKRVYRKSQPHEQMYVVINKHGEVYAGMIQGDLQWSYDWSQAKPLYKNNTERLYEVGEYELIKEEEII